VPDAAKVTFSFAVIEATFVPAPVMRLLGTLKTAALPEVQLVPKVVPEGLGSHRVPVVVVQEAVVVAPQNMAMSPLGTTSPLLSWVAVYYFVPLKK
jgi:hypothetical protein